jgi:hypothetical protein
MSGGDISGMGTVRELGFAIGIDFACERNSNAASIQLSAFYVKVT